MAPRGRPPGRRAKPWGAVRRRAEHDPRTGRLGSCDHPASRRHRAGRSRNRSDPNDTPRRAAVGRSAAQRSAAQRGTAQRGTAPRGTAPRPTAARRGARRCGAARRALPSRPLATPAAGPLPCRSHTRPLPHHHRLPRPQPHPPPTSSRAVKPRSLPPPRRRRPVAAVPAAAPEAHGCASRAGGPQDAERTRHALPDCCAAGVALHDGGVPPAETETRTCPARRPSSAAPAPASPRGW